MKKQLAILVLSTALLSGCASWCNECAGTDCDIVVKEKMILDATSNFAFDSAKLSMKDTTSLEKAVARLKADPDEKVRINGYTDSTGTDAYNMKLSEQRAWSVAKYLEKEGIAADRIQTKGYGKTNYVASNATSEGRAKNRRAEVLFYE